MLAPILMQHLQGSLLTTTHNCLIWTHTNQPHDVNLWEPPITADNYHPRGRHTRHPWFCLKAKQPCMHLSHNKLTNICYYPSVCHAHHQVVRCLANTPTHAYVIMPMCCMSSMCWTVHTRCTVHHQADQRPCMPTCHCTHIRCYCTHSALTHIGRRPLPLTLCTTNTASLAYHDPASHIGSALFQHGCAPPNAYPHSSPRHNARLPSCQHLRT